MILMKSLHQDYRFSVIYRYLIVYRKNEPVVDSPVLSKKTLPARQGRQQGQVRAAAAAAAAGSNTDDEDDAPVTQLAKRRRRQPIYIESSDDDFEPDDPAESRPVVAEPTLDDLKNMGLVQDSDSCCSQSSADRNGSGPSGGGSQAWSPQAAL